MPTNPTPLMDMRFACLVKGERASDYEALEIGMRPAIPS